ncbi:MAG: iron ABC transporter permease [Ectothiorhodospiraceae bacterium]|nr:iron ABC transporter permease [Ectothiorhodospiraceae bacterium]
MAAALKRAPPLPALIALGVGLLICGLLALRTGPYQLGLMEVWRILSGSTEADLAATMVVRELRLPRLLLGALVGAALALSGAMLQGLFRNPLADPGLIGVSSGAALGAVGVIVLGERLFSVVGVGVPAGALPVAAFVGALVATLVIWRIASRNGTTQVALLLLAGIAINAIAGAGTGVLTFMADDAQLRTLTFWSMGSLAHASWPDLRVTAPLLLILLLAMPMLARPLNALLLGEAVAGHLGHEVHRVKQATVLLSALAVGAAVSVSGLIGFVGLVAPHLVRLTIGVDHRWLLPASALLGACLLVSADMLARVVVAPAELPIGLVMALIGGPFFLILLMRQRWV